LEVSEAACGNHRLHGDGHPAAVLWIPDDALVVREKRGEVRLHMVMSGAVPGFRYAAVIEVMGNRRSQTLAHALEARCTSTGELAMTTTVDIDVPMSLSELEEPLPSLYRFVVDVFDTFDETLVASADRSLSARIDRALRDGDDAAHFKTNAEEHHKDPSGPDNPAAASFADDTYPSGYDSEFAAVNLGVHRGADLCLPRAVDWHAYCQNGPDIPVTATYTPTGESLTYPPDTAAEDLPSHQLWPPPPPSCRWPSEGQTGAGEGVAQRLKVAVVVAGQLFRFAYETLYDGVVHPNVEAGHEVDVFIYLARDDAGGLHNHRHWAQRETKKPNGDPRMEESLRERVAASIASPRSSLRGWDVGNHWRLVEELGEYRFAQWRGKDRTARVHQYEGW